MGLKKSKKLKKIQKNLKKSKFYQKIAKIFDITKLKNYSMGSKNFSVTYYQPPRMFAGPWVWKDLNKEKNVKKFEKIARFVKKLLKLVVLKYWNHSITTRNNAVT